ncbi:MAG TPA: hypothetical protein VFE98_04455 [Candidatus Bathyarchaeia archaeon]|nr:hypothetical protein [Candidatus Bathyarchaeia archaeon]
MSSKLHGYSPNELFRVDKPRQALQALCSLKKTIIDSKTFKDAYEKATGNEFSASTTKYIEYFLVQFGLLKETRVRTKHEITELTEHLCEALSGGDMETYAQLWAGAILKQELKIQLIKDFLRTVSEPKSKSDIDKKFRRNAGVLLALCKEGGLVSEKDDLVYSLQPRVKSPEEFWEKLLEAYRKLSRTNIPGVKRNFIEIIEIYHALLPYLDWRKDDAFDEFMRIVVRQPEYRTRIELSGAPVSYVTEKGLRPFVLDGKRYYYLSIAGGSTYNKI